MHHDPLHRFVQLQECPQRRVLERLQFVVHRRLPILLAICNLFQEDLNLLGRDDVADVFRVTQVAEYQSDHLVPRHGGSPLFPGLIASSIWMRSPETG